jgi:hypothetical protein
MIYHSQATMKLEPKRGNSVGIKEDRNRNMHTQKNYCTAENLKCGGDACSVEVA